MAGSAPGATAHWRPSAPKSRPFRFGDAPRIDPDTPLGAGDRIGDRYRVVKLIGQGGMGRVYEAAHVTLDRRVAVKLLRRDESSAEDLARFRREAQAATAIGHPSIVQVVDFAQTTTGQVYLVMELLSGESLESWMSRPQTFGEALPWLAEIARGLGAAHRAGVVHRDIKPANLFIHRDRGAARAKVLDFGIAKVTRADYTQIPTQAGTVLGTPYYLAPERALGQPLDGRADLYSLGVLLYEMLTGGLPFDGESFMDVVLQHIKAAPLDPRQAAPDRAIPDELCALVMALLAKTPQQRPPDGESVANELDRIAEVHRGPVVSLVCGVRSPADNDHETVGLGALAQQPTIVPSVPDGPTVSPAQSRDPGASTVRFGSLGQAVAVVGSPPARRRWWWSGRVFVVLAAAAVGGLVAGWIALRRLGSGLAPSFGSADAAASSPSSGRPQVRVPGPQPTRLAPREVAEPTPKPKPMSGPKPRSKTGSGRDLAGSVAQPTPTSATVLDNGTRDGPKAKPPPKPRSKAKSRKRTATPPKADPEPTPPTAPVPHQPPEFKDEYQD